MKALLQSYQRASTTSARFSRGSIHFPNIVRNISPISTHLNTDLITSDTMFHPRLKDMQIQLKSIHLSGWDVETCAAAGGRQRAQAASSNAHWQF